MIHIEFDVTDFCDSWKEANMFVTKIREWLEANAGIQDIGWKWIRGDTVTQGVIIADDQVAVMFRLKFGL